MKHLICRVSSFKNIGPYILRIKFDDGRESEIDFQPVLFGNLYGPLKDKKLFNQVEIDPEVHTLVWPNGADFDPETLYNWPKYLKIMKRITNQPELKTTQAV